MKIAFVNSNLILCGGIITNYEYISRLKQRGFDARLLSNTGNEDLEKYYSLPHDPIETLREWNDDDVIIANRWEQTKDLEKYNGIKIQLVQGRDEDANYGEDWKIIMREARNNKKWELIGVSQFCLDDWGRGKVIANGISSRFFYKETR